MDNEIRKRCDDLFFWYENNEFDPDGYKPRDIELVENFLEYLEKQDEVDMANGLELYDIMPDDKAEKLAWKLRNKMIKGCEKWLGYDEDPVQGLIKATKELEYGKVFG